MARRSDHTREELKNLILQAARTIIKESGSQSLTMRKIATAIGYAPGSIYNVFKSMDDLILALNAITLDNLYEAIRIKSGRYKDKETIKNVKAMARYYHTFSKNHRPHWLLLFNYELSNTKTTPDWYAEKVSRLFDPLNNLLKQTHPNQNHKLTVKSLWASVHGICFLEQTEKMALTGKNIKATNMINHLINQFFD